MPSYDCHPTEPVQPLLPLSRVGVFFLVAAMLLLAPIDKSRSLLTFPIRKLALPKKWALGFWLWTMKLISLLWRWGLAPSSIPPLWRQALIIWAEVLIFYLWAMTR